MRRGSTTLLLVLASCGSPDPTTPEDAGIETGPQPVAAPLFEPCPPGWTALDGACEPFADGASDCAAGTHPVPGQGCAPIGACPSGDWPTDLPAGTAVYVRADAPAGGDGTRERPFARIAEALVGAPPGTVAVLGEGTYDEPVALRDGYAVVGLCPARTRIHNTNRALAGQTVAAVGAGALLRGVSLGGADFAMIADGADTDVTLEGVVIEDYVELAIAVTAGATVRLTDVSVRGSDARPDAGAELDAGSTLVGERTSWLGLHGAAVLLYGEGARFEAADSTFRGTREDPRMSAPPSAVAVEHGAHAALRRVAIEGGDGFGVYAHDGATGELEDVVVRDTGDRGVELWYGADVALRRVQIVGTGDVGLHARETAVSIEDVLIRGTRAVRDAGGGGLIAWTAEVDGARIRIEDCLAFGAVMNRGGDARLEDLAIVDVAGDPRDGTRGRALQVINGATVEVARLQITRSRDVGVVVGLGDASLTMTDAVVEATREQGCAETTCECCAGGTGVVVLEARLSARDFAVRDNDLAGIYALEGGALDLEGGVVSDNPIGLNLQSAPVDVGRDVRAVEFVDCDRNLARDAIAPPEIVDVLDAAP